MSYIKSQLLGPDENEVTIRPDHCALQDATGQITLLSLLNNNVSEIKIPASIHCDHLLNVSDEDPIKSQHEVYQFLESCSHKYKMDFFCPGEGIIHSHLLEHYAKPGTVIIATDSHVPTVGANGCLGIAVGSTLAAEALTSGHFTFKSYPVVALKLKGKMPENLTAKDVALFIGKHYSHHFHEKYVEIVTSNDFFLETFERATLCNFAQEWKAVSVLFPPRDKIKEEMYESVFEVHLDKLTPVISGPNHPLNCVSLDQFSSKSGSAKVSSSFIGSCTHSSFEELLLIDHILWTLKESGESLKCPLYITPGSPHFLKSPNLKVLSHPNQTKDLYLLPSACGPCAGRINLNATSPSPEIYMTSFNRNFPGRLSGRIQDLVFIASPMVCLAAAFSKDMSELPKVYDRLIDIYKDFNKKISSKTLLDRPASPPKEPVKKISPIKYGPRIQPLPSVKINPDQKTFRLKLFDSFKGPVSTDEISPAGDWLHFRGNVPKISENFFSRMLSSSSDSRGVRAHDNEFLPYLDLLKKYKERDDLWFAVCNDSFAEGSSRETAALSFLYWNGVGVIAPQFSHIFQDNLKRHGGICWIPLQEIPTDFYEPDLSYTFSFKEIKENFKIWQLSKNGTKESYFLKSRV